MKLTVRLFCSISVMLLFVLLAGCTGNLSGSTENQSGLPCEINLSDFENYQQVAEFISANPDTEFFYHVSIGDQTVPHDTALLTVPAGEDVFDSLMNNLQYLPDVTDVLLQKTDLPLEHITALRNAYPHVNIRYTFTIAGKPVSEETKWLDLSHISSHDMDEVLAKLPMMPGLVNVNLVNGSGESNLELADVSRLQNASPNTFFNYQFDLFGQSVSTRDEIVEFDEVPIGNEGEAQIRQALDVLDNCTYFKLDDCGIDNEIMASIRADYPETKVVWRIHIDPFSMLTDETMLRLTFHLNDDNMHDLKYLNDVTYLDVGHNLPLTDISFVQYMPKLECVIISGSSVEDVSYFKHCQNLVWLEFCFCYKIQDISCLTDHPTLKYLNISYTAVSDLSPLENVDLDRLNAMKNNVDYLQREAFTENHPECLSVWDGVQPYGYGWRYNDYGYTFFEYYANMRKVFRYDETGYFGNHKEH